MGLYGIFVLLVGKIENLMSNKLLKAGEGQLVGYRLHKKFRVFRFNKQVVF